MYPLCFEQHSSYPMSAELAIIDVPKIPDQCGNNEYKNFTMERDY